jgi:hypothetical protein
MVVVVVVVAVALVRLTGWIVRLRRVRWVPMYFLE